MSHWYCTLGTGIKIGDSSVEGKCSSVSGSGVARSNENKWHKSIAPTVGQETKLRMRTKASAEGCAVKNGRRNSLKDRSSGALLFVGRRGIAGAQRKVDWPSARRPGDGWEISHAIECSGPRLLPANLLGPQREVSSTPPVLSKQWSQPGGEGIGMCKKLPIGGKLSGHSEKPALRGQRTCRERTLRSTFWEEVVCMVSAPGG